MSRFGEGKNEFGSEGAKAYYKAQAPPGGASSFAFPYNDDQAKKPAAKSNPAPAAAAPAEEKENVPSPRNQHNTDQKNDRNEHKARAKAMQTSSIFGNSDANAPKKAEKKEEEDKADSGRQEPVLPKPQLDMKNNDYPKEEPAEKPAQNSGMKVGYRVKQPPGGASSGLW